MDMKLIRGYAAAMVAAILLGIGSSYVTADDEQDPHNKMAELLNIMRDENQERGIRRNAANSLGDADLNPIIDEYLEEMIELLEVRDGNVRLRVRHRLTGMGEDALNALVPLVAEPGVHGQEASLALSRMGEAGRDAIIPLLTHEDEDMRIRGAEALREMLQRTRTEPAPAVAALIVSLDDQSPKVRELSAVALQFAGTAGAPASGALAARMDDPEESVILAALAAIRHIGEGGPNVIETIGRLMLNEERPVNARVAAANALGEIGPDALDKLLAGLRSPVYNVRVASAERLAGMPAVSIAPLIQLLGDDDADVRRFAAYALAKSGEAALPAKDALIALAVDEYNFARRNAVDALGAIGGEGDTKVIETLLIALNDHDHGVRIAAARALGKAGKFSESAARALCGVIRPIEESADMKRAAAQSLARLELPLPYVIDALSHALLNDPPEVRWAAAEALAALGAPSIAALERSAQDDAARPYAEFALGRIEQVRD